MVELGSAGVVMPEVTVEFISEAPSSVAGGTITTDSLTVSAGSLTVGGTTLLALSRSFSDFEYVSPLLPR